MTLKKRTKKTTVVEMGEIWLLPFPDEIDLLEAFPFTPIFKPLFKYGVFHHYEKGEVFSRATKVVCCESFNLDSFKEIQAEYFFTLNQIFFLLRAEVVGYGEGVYRKGLKDFGLMTGSTCLFPYTNTKGVEMIVSVSRDMHFPQCVILEFSTVSPTEMNRLRGLKCTLLLPSTGKEVSDLLWSMDAARVLCTTFHTR